MSEKAQKESRGRGDEQGQITRREATKIPGLISVTVARTISRCSMIAPQSSMLAGKGALYELPLLSRLRPYWGLLSAMPNTALLFPIPTATPLPHRRHRYSHISK